MNAFSCISEQPVACISSCPKRPEEQPPEDVAVPAAPRVAATERKALTYTIPPTHCLDKVLKTMKATS